MKRTGQMKRTAICLLLGIGLSVTATSALAAFQTGAYSGRTGAGYAISFNATRDRVGSFRYKSRFRCTGGATFAAKGGPYNGIRIHNGRFDATLRNPSRSLAAHVEGTLKNRRAAGRISRTARFNSAGQLDPRGRRKCTSSTTWSASHP